MTKWHGQTQEERLWAGIDRRGPDECWPWLRGLSRPGGYGIVRFDGRRQRVTRVLLDAPSGMEAMHSCDNPPCCNPAHLSLGTHTENMQQAAAAGSLGWTYTADKPCPKGHLGPWNYPARSTGRVCYTCAAERKRAWRAARRAAGLPIS